MSCWNVSVCAVLSWDVFTIRRWNATELVRRPSLAFVETVIKRFAFSPSLSVPLSLSLFCLSLLELLLFLGPVSLSAFLLKLSCLQLSLSLLESPQCIGSYGVKARHLQLCDHMRESRVEEWGDNENLCAVRCSQIKDQLYCFPHWSTIGAQGPYLEAHSSIHSLIHAMINFLTFSHEPNTHSSIVTLIDLLRISFYHLLI